MSSEPNSYRSLRAYYSVPMLSQDPAVLARDLQAESDRAMVVIGGSLLEDGLREMIRTKLRPMDVQELRELRIFAHDGPIGGFSKTITVAYALGLIDGQTVKELTDIREMRNACAHSFRPIDFKTPELANVCKRLFSGDENLFKMETDGDRDKMRLAFVTVFVTLMTVISHGSREEAQAVLRSTVAELNGVAR